MLTVRGLHQLPQAPWLGGRQGLALPPKLPNVLPSPAGSSFQVVKWLQATCLPGPGKLDLCTWACTWPWVRGGVWVAAGSQGLRGCLLPALLTGIDTWPEGGPCLAHLPSSGCMLGTVSYSHTHRVTDLPFFLLFVCLFYQKCVQEPPSLVRTWGDGEKGLRGKGCPHGHSLRHSGRAGILLPVSWKLKAV